ncbi:DUF995 domain-containing protein (plasmid) [Sinorhizobium meliloti]|nr:DUF995 domain-containing protein [Sinorhizobium meliloti]
MESEDRAFWAWAQSSTGESWAEGRWSVNDRGQLCLMAVWHSQSAAAPRQDLLQPPHARRNHLPEKRAVGRVVRL